MTDFDLDIPEIHFPDTIELDDDIDFSVADFSIVDEEEQTRIIKPKMAKSAIYNKAAAEAAKAAAEAKKPDFVWSLSARELEMVKELGRGGGA